jgi:cobalt/nickel transport system permease protein
MVAVVILAYGVFMLKKLVDKRPELKPYLALAGAFVFVLSSLKIPSVTGSCSHPTGTGLAVVFFGPAVTSVLSSIVLLYQALLLAHGGITTFGANVTSMGIIGPLVGWIVYKTLRKAGVNILFTVFIVSTVADYTTYVVTSAQMALAFPASVGGVLGSFKVFMAIFAVTQLPLAIIEGIASVLLFKYLMQVKPDFLSDLKILARGEKA